MPNTPLEAHVVAILAKVSPISKVSHPPCLCLQRARPPFPNPQSPDTLPIVRLNAIREGGVFPVILYLGHLLN